MSKTLVDAEPGTWLVELPVPSGSKKPLWQSLIRRTEEGADAFTGETADTTFQESDLQLNDDEITDPDYNHRILTPDEQIALVTRMRMNPEFASAWFQAKVNDLGEPIDAQ